MTDAFVRVLMEELPLGLVAWTQLVLAFVSRLFQGRQPLLGRGCALEAAGALDIVIQEELEGMRAEPHRIDFLRALVPDPGFDQIL
jgi:hypothetical protein